MKISWTKTLAAGALTFGVAHACATQINGTIDFGDISGAVKLENATHLAGGATFQTATRVDFVNSISQASIISSSDGDFTSFSSGVITTATFKDFDIGAPVSKLWKLDVNPTMDYFDLVTSQNASPDNTFLNIKGTGIVYLAGKDPTPGTFTLTASRSRYSQVQFSFASSTSATPTPDGGATAGLLGLGLTCVGAIARRVRGESSQLGSR